ncbi:hypothetical protein [Rufibacter quisquiliarum]|uniref:Uncharacterized protein n=1 Tax=Rufibacter quisquiliarum TaxID=1549639 RepID=A0A839GKF6_9BACT|nr:hypothetical protein [Rufibacter quisquiliarum]MBA9076075.1 hypothetical protein [Rufibacter quisquiliarum]
MKKFIIFLLLVLPLEVFAQKYEYRGIKNFPVNAETGKVSYDSVVAVEKINRLGRSMRFVAIPAHQVRRMAEGGALPGDGGAQAAGNAPEGYTMVPNVTLERIEGYLADIAGSNSQIATSNAHIAAKPPIDRTGAWQLTQMAKEEQADIDFGQLLK